MDASRLLTVLEDLESEFAGGLIDRLNKLVLAYTSARDTPAQDQTPAIRQAHSELTAYLTDSVVNSYTPSRRQLLVSVGAEMFAGHSAASYLDDLVKAAALTPASVVTSLQTYVTQLNQFRKACTQARQGLAALKIEADELAHTDAEVGVLVPRMITKGHLDALAREFTAWNRILRGFSELAGDDTREISVKLLSTGSDQLFLVMSVSAAVILAKVIDKILEWYRKILDIQIARTQLARLGAPVPETEAVKNHEKQLLEESITTLAKELMSLAPKSIPSSRRSELENQLTISIRQITRFVDQGGDVEVIVPPPPKKEFVPPTDSKGEPLPPEELETKKAEWDALQEQQTQKWLALSQQGAALASLPQRSRPIFQLSEAGEEEASAEDIAKEEKEEKKKKK